MAMFEETSKNATVAAARNTGMPTHHRIIFAVMLLVILAMPFFVYPVFAMKLLCFAAWAAT